MKFIKLTRPIPNSPEVYVNFGLVKKFQPNLPSGTRIVFEDGNEADYLSVQEPPEYILRLISNTDC